jgi:hypothetical protein
MKRGAEPMEKRTHARSRLNELGAVIPHAADELAALMGPVAREILGEPNKALSRPTPAPVGRETRHYAP